MGCGASNAKRAYVTQAEELCVKCKEELSVTDVTDEKTVEPEEQTLAIAAPREFPESFLSLINSPITTLAQYVAMLIEETLSLLSGDRCSVFFVNETRQEIWCVGAKGLNPFSMPLTHGIVGAVAREGVLLNLRDAHDHPAFDNTVEKRTGYKTRSMICLPIKHAAGPSANSSRPVGVMQVLNKKGGANTEFSEKDAAAFERLREVISSSFYRQRFRALELGVSFEDNEVQSLLSSHRSHVFQGRVASIDEIYTSPRRPSDSALLIAEWGDLDAKFEPNDLPTDEQEKVQAEQLESLEFNVLDRNLKDLTKLVPYVFERTGIIQRCSVPPKCMDAWADAVRAGYPDNPFHNYFHGFGVFQMCYYQLQLAKIFQNLSALQVFALLTASLCHDIGHPGRTNAFLILIEHPWAVRYNDRSVLENHHASVAWTLLKSNSTNVAAGLDFQMRKTFRKLVVDSILSTDMAVHSELCGRLTSINSSEELLQTCAEDHQLLMHWCIHTSDLSGQSLPWTEACRWEERISQEFVNQAEEERSLGRDPLPFMNFQFGDTKLRGKLQRDFIDFVLVPLWEPYTQMLPELLPCYENLSNNRSKYEKMRIQDKNADSEE